LIESGLLDSLALVELVFAIEQELGVQIPAERLEVERFRTLAKLVDLVGECRDMNTSDMSEVRSEGSSDATSAPTET